ncbi:MAG: hypothetical protein D6705_14905 [Deltaproteobacteria bacterium]|nr:MAG: hypothetical protein D6705_14905 [Deltaproteobacteria bacterium]
MQHQSSRRNHHGLFAYAIFALCGAAAAGCTDNLGGVEHDGGGGSTFTGDTTDGVSGGAGGGTGGSSGGGFDEADIVGCLQDPENRVPCAFEGLADPAAWSVDPVTMLRYRRVTSKEREANGWPASAYLVEATPHLSAVEAGADVLPPLPIPLADDEVRVVAFGSLGKEVGPPHVAVRNGEAVLEEPVFVRYVSQPYELPDALVTVVGTEGGLEGLAAFGTAGSYDLEIRSHAPGWYVEPMAGAPDEANLVRIELYVLSNDQAQAKDSCGLGVCNDACMTWAPIPCEPVLPGDPPNCKFEGNHPCESQLPPYDYGACTDGLDNDGDGYVDIDGAAKGPDAFDGNCRHSDGCFAGGTGWSHEHRHESGEPFLLTGNLPYCAKDGDWQGRLYAKAVQAIGVFRQKVGWDPYDALTGPKDAIVRWVGSQCWVLPMDEAEACETEGECGPYGPGTAHEYPFAGFDGYYDPYLDASWAAVAHAAEAGLTQPATISAVVIESHNNADYQNSAARGLARLPGAWPAGSLVVSERGGDTPWASPCVLPHEMAHTMGATHVDVPGSLMYGTCGMQMRKETAEIVRAAAVRPDVPREYSFGL